MIEVVFYFQEQEVKPETHQMKQPPMRGDILRRKGMHYEVMFRVWRYGSHTLEVYCKKTGINEKFNVLV